MPEDQGAPSFEWCAEAETAGLGVRALNDEHAFFPCRFPMSTLPRFTGQMFLYLEAFPVYTSLAPLHKDPSPGHR